VKSNRKLATVISCLMVFGLAVAQASSDLRKLGDTRSVALPAYAILDENAQPVIASSGKLGFVSSVTAGSLIRRHPSAPPLRPPGRPRSDTVLA